MSRPWPTAPMAAWRHVMGRPPGDPWAPDYNEEREIVDAVAVLTRGFGTDRRLIGKRYLEDPALLGAYLLLFAPISHAQAGHLLDRLGGTDLRGCDVLDVGCGPGSMARAALDRGARTALGLDGSEGALELARGVVDDRRFRTQPWRHGAPLPDGSWDIIVAGHVLNEISGPDPTGARVAFVEAIRARLRPGGTLLLIEPARHERCAELLAVRDAVAEAGVGIVGPCTHSAPCPARAEAAPCHSTLLWEAPPWLPRLAERAHLDKEVLAYSWLALAGPDERVAEAPAHRVRVVSEPMLNKAGRHRRLVCGSSGRFPLSTPPRDGQMRSWARQWKELDRHDLLDVEGPEERDRGWGLGDGTVIHRIGERRLGPARG